MCLFFIYCNYFNYADENTCETYAAQRNAGRQANKTNRRGITGGGGGRGRAVERTNETKVKAGLAKSLHQAGFAGSCPFPAC